MKKTIGLIVVLIAGIVLFYVSGISEQFQSVSHMQAWFQGQGAWGYLTFVAICILTAVFMLPGGLLALVAGIVFGGVIGGLLTAIGSTIGATVAFVLGKTMLRETIVKKYGRNKAFQRIMQGVKDNGTEFLILTRLVPIFPYAIQSYAYALTPMKTGKFTLISGITMLPACLIYAIFASDILTKGLSVGLSIKFTIMGILLFALTYIPKRIAKKRHMLKG